MSSINKGLFFWKIFGGYVALILVGAALSAVILTNRLGASFDQEIDDDLVETARLTMVLFPADPDAAKEVLAGFDGSHARHITVMDGTGAVLADSHAGTEATPNKRSHTEISKAIENGETTISRFSSTLQAPARIHARYDAERNRIVRVAVSEQIIQRRIGALGLGILIVSGLSALIAIVIGYLLTRHITTPLARMSEAADALARGEKAVRISPPDRSELGVLATSLNHLASELDKRLDTITGDRNQLQAILAGITEGLIAVDPNGVIIHCNPAARALIGSDGDEIGRNISEVSTITEVHQAFMEVLEECRPVNRECTLTDGTADTNLHLTVDQVSDETGTTGAVMVLTDITDQRRLEAVRRDFVTNVSHELKTPLTTIIGAIETITDDPDMPDDIRARFLSRAIEQGNRLAALITDLLTLSRLESAQNPTNEAIDVGALVRTSHRSLAAKADEKSIDLGLDDQADGLHVQGDPEILRQAVDNLLVNAITYTDDGGAVTVTARKHGDNEVEIAVTDSGIGITPEEVERIFERFYRVDKARSRQLGGTGLGLSIIKHAAITHGGRIEVDSTVGEGSTFQLFLPTA